MLSSFQEALVLSACPPGTQILSAQPVRRYLQPCPFDVRVRLLDTTEQDLILKIDRFQNGVELEAVVLTALASSGLPVATILAGPSIDSDAPTLGSMLVLSCLDGVNLLRRGRTATEAEKIGLGELVLDGVEALHGATSDVRSSLSHLQLPARSVLNELRGVVDNAGEMLDDPELQRAVAHLEPLARRVEQPLVFSNGDFNPANFLSDGYRITGIVDFGGTCWEDPLLGVAKYATFGWLPYDSKLLLESWIRRMTVTRAEMELRVAVACIIRLRDLEPRRTARSVERKHSVRARLREALEVIG